MKFIFCVESCDYGANSAKDAFALRPDGKIANLKELAPILDKKVI